VICEVITGRRRSYSKICWCNNASWRKVYSCFDRYSRPLLSWDRGLWKAYFISLLKPCLFTFLFIAFSGNNNFYSYAMIAFICIWISCELILYGKYGEFMVFPKSVVQVLGLFCNWLYMCVYLCDSVTWWDSLSISKPLDIDYNSVVFVARGVSSYCVGKSMFWSSVFFDLRSFCLPLPGVLDVILFLASFFLSISNWRKLLSAMRLATWTLVCLPSVYSSKLSLICLLRRGELRTKLEVWGTTERLRGVISALFFTSEDLVFCLFFSSFWRSIFKAVWRIDYFASATASKSSDST